MFPKIKREYLHFSLLIIKFAASNKISKVMKKLIFAVLALLVSTLSSNASGVFVNSDGFLEMTEVIQVPNLSKSELFDAVLENLNLKATGQSANFSVAGSSQENGNVDVYGRLYLGYYKPMESVVFGGGLDVWAHYKMLVRCKDGKIKYQCTITDVIFHKQSDPSGDSDVAIPISRCWPVFTEKKASGKIKKAAQQCLPKVMTELKNYMDSATETYKDIDDF